MGRRPRLWLLVAALAASPAAAWGQGLVVRDGTLGTGDLEVGPGTDPLGSSATYLITPELGEQHGQNLFHSFSSFGVGSGETATFTGPDPIDGPQSVSNVISRVTGGGKSQINGTLRSTIPGADVWLLNPSGVVFGEGAQLDVPGSFHASTGDYLGFGEGGLERFYTDGRPSVLATAPPAAFGFLGEGPAAAISVTGATLAVPEGETLSLVGGEVVLDAATLTAENGRVNLAAVASAGEVILGPADAAEPLDVRGFEKLGEIRLETRDDVGSLVDVSGESPGSVFIRGGQLVIEGPRRAPQLADDPSERSRILAENGGAGPGGSISIETSKSVLVDNGLLSVNTTSAGNAGSIYVKSPDVTFQNGPGNFHDVVSAANPRNQPHATQVGASAETSSSGSGGRIEIDAGSLKLSSGVSVSARAVLATGDAGFIRIGADSMEVLDRSDVDAGVPGGYGNGGTIQIDVAGRLRMDGASDSATITTSVYSVDGSHVPGAPGAIDIKAGSVELLPGGNIFSYCGTCTSKANTRSGDAAKLRIAAGSILISPSANVDVGLYDYSEGDAGTIEIETGSLEVRGYIDAGSLRGSSGNAGKITFDADSVVITDKGLIRADTEGAGAGGHFAIDARTVLIERGSIITAGSRTTGEAGTIDISASESILLDGAGDDRFSLLGIVNLIKFGLRPRITGIFSAGDSGSITLDAPDITLTDGALVLVTTSNGDAGDVLLSGERIYVRNGALVDSTSLVPGGNVGNITLEATELIEVSGSRAGVFKLMGKLTPYEDVSRVTSASLGSGEGGTVTLDAPLILIDGGAVATTALPSFFGYEGVSGGNISVNAGELIVRGGGRIDGSSFIAGPGGNIDVTASDSIVVEGKASDGTASGISSRTGAGGAGGAVTLRAPVIEVSEGGEVSAKSEADPNLEQEVGRIFDSLRDNRVFIGTVPSEATGNAGSVTLTADEVRLTGGTIATNAEGGDGGSVTIEAKQLVHLDGGVITAAVSDGSGGNITIDPEVVILQNGSRIVADAGTGSGGNIQITADNYFAFPGSVVDASSELGIDGSVEVSTPDVDLAGTLTALPANYLDASSLMRERCAARRSGERAGSFAVRGNGGIPAEPDGWLPAAVAFEARPVPLGMAEVARAVAIAAASTPSGTWPLPRTSCR